MLQVIKALADPTRLRLVGILEHGEFTVQELTAILEMGQSRISRHLKIMVEAGVCAVQRQGTWGYFRLNGQDDFFESIRPQVLERIEQVEGYRNDLTGVARVLDKRRQKSRHFFDRHAREWDKMASDLIPVAHYAGLVFEKIGAGNIVVDVGVGTGRLLQGLSERSRHVIGVDHSAPMLDEAKARIESEQLNNVELRLGELTHLPVADGVANGMVLNMVLHHAASPPAVFAELNRVLEPGGQLIIADLVRHEMEWFRDQMADQWMGFERSEIEKWLESSGYRSGSYRQVETNEKLPSVFVLTAEKIRNG